MLGFSDTQFQAWYEDTQYFWQVMHSTGHLLGATTKALWTYNVKPYPLNTHYKVRMLIWHSSWKYFQGANDIYHPIWGISRDLSRQSNLRYGPVYWTFSLWYNPTWCQSNAPKHLQNWLPMPLKKSVHTTTCLSYHSSKLIWSIPAMP